MKRFMPLRHVVHFFRSPNVARWKKLLGFGVLAYVVMPFDAIPDVMPVIGWLDDIGALAMLAAAANREMRRSGVEVVEAEVLPARP